MPAIDLMSFMACYSQETDIDKHVIRIESERALTEKSKIKGYWEIHQPGTWNLEEEEGTREYFDETERRRYVDPGLQPGALYAWIPEMFEFYEHPGETVLEVGCGIGTDASQWAKGGAIYTGVDLTEKAVSMARKRFEIYGYKGEFRTADAENLPFEPESFDIVYSFGVLHHTPDTQKAINEVYRVLKPGGRAFIMLYHKACDYYLTQFRFGILRGEMFRMSAQEVLNKYTEVKGNSPLTKCYTRKQADQLFSQFSKREYHVRRLHGPLNKPYLFWLEKIIGWNLAIKATK